MTKHKKLRAHQRRSFKTPNPSAFLSIECRNQVIDMQAIPANRRRLAFINAKIRQLGGLKGKGTWGKNSQTIEKLYQGRKEVKEKLARLQPFANDKLLYNCSPHYTAKALGIALDVVYRVLKIYARSGNVRFSRDHRSHISPATAGNGTPKVPQSACHGLNPCPAPNCKLEAPPRSNAARWNDSLVWKTVNRSKRLFEEYKEFSAVSIQSADADDYYRTSITDDSMPSLSYKSGQSKRRHTKFFDLLKHAYELNVAAGRIAPISL